MIDVVTVGILLIFGVIGYKKGLVKSAITLLSSITALILSFIGYPLINMGLKLTPVYQVVYDATLKKVQAIDFGQGVQAQGNAILTQINWLPQIITEAIKNNNNVVTYEALGVQTLQDYITIYITNIIINLLAILITWFVLKVILRGGLKMLGGVVEHLPVIATFNKGGGFLFGILKGIIALSVIGLIIPLFSSYPSFGVLTEGITSSLLTKWLYEHNFILGIFNRYL